MGHLPHRDRLFYVDGATSLLADTLIAILPWRQLNGQSAGPDAIEETNDRIIPQPLRYSDVLRDRLFIYFLSLRTAPPGGFRLLGSTLSFESFKRAFEQLPWLIPGLQVA